jgi:outer membrane protein
LRKYLHQGFGEMSCAARRVKIRNGFTPAAAGARALAVLMVLTLPQAASAETLRQALISAYQTNPKLDAERAKLRAVDEEVPRAQSGYRPTVEGSLDIGHQDSRSNPANQVNGQSDPWGYSISVKQSVFNGFRTTNEVASSEAQVKEGRENLRQTESTVLLDAVTAYMDVVRDMEIVRIRENNVKVLARDLVAAETRRGAREVTKTDVAQARARHAKSISATDLARANLKVSRASYERVIGHAPSSVSLPPLKLKLLPRSIEDAWQTAERESPNLSAAVYREEAARYTVDKISGELLPEVTVQANYDHRESPNTFYKDQDATTVTGRLSVPLYEGGEVRARVRQAKHTHVSRIQEIQQARTETQANVTSAWSKLMAARAQLKSDQIQVEANRMALEGVREEERVGQRTLLDVLNAEVEYLDAQIQLVATRHDLVVAGYQVLATTGQLNAESLELASEVYNPDEHLQEARQNWFGIDITHADGRREAYEATDTENLPPDIVE